MAWIVISFGIRLNWILWRNARLISLTTRMRRSISGTCSFALVRFTLGPTGIFDAFKAIFRFHLQQGFHIQTVHADGEFGALKDLIQNIPVGPRVNLTSANEHVPEIERRICVVKEISCAFRHSLPFNRIPKLMTIHAILNISKMLNYFPTKQGISSDLSPRSILTGESLDYKRNLSLHPGQ